MLEFNFTWAVKQIDSDFTCQLFRQFFTLALLSFDFIVASYFIAFGFSLLIYFAIAAIFSNFENFWNCLFNFEVMAISNFQFP